MNKVLGRTAALVVVLAIANAAGAQTTRSGSDSARVMQQLQQLTTERTALQSENAKLKQELDAAKAELSRLKGEQGALERRAQSAAATAARLTQSADTSNAALERSRAQLEELIERFRQTAQTLREVESDRSEARSALAARERELGNCIDRNVGLYELNLETLDRLEGRGSWSRLAESEPFTRIARTRLENLIDEYRDRVEELRLERTQQEPARPDDAPSGSDGAAP